MVGSRRLELTSHQGSPFLPLPFNIYSGQPHLTDGKAEARRRDGT